MNFIEVSLPKAFLYIICTI